jgi:hypothetical protein
MKRVLILCLLLVSPAAAYERLQGPTELLTWNKEKAFSGYTLFGVGGRSYLIDMEGRVVHKTVVAGDPEASIKAAAGPAGDFLYRFGDPARSGQGEPPAIQEDWTQPTSGHKQIGGCHDVHWIRPGLPGAGHIMIFNNGQYLLDRTSQSSIVEINPFLDAQGKDTGRYVNPPDGRFAPDEGGESIEPQAIAANSLGHEFEIALDGIRHSAR